MKSLSYFLLSVVFLCWSCNDNSNNTPEKDIPKTSTAKLSIELGTLETEWVAKGNSFAVNLLNRACEVTESENVLLSPLSLQYALGMLSNGASEKAQGEIATTLGFKNFSIDKMNNFFSGFTSSLSEGDPFVTLTLANAIWIMNGFPIKDAFIRTNKDVFQAEVGNVLFGSAEAKTTIDQWCYGKTNGTIREAPFANTASLCLLLANACYFKGTWVLPFESTINGTFTTSKNEVQKVKMMTLNNTLNYSGTSTFQAVELPYGNESFSMVVVLPREDYTVESIAADMDWKNLRMGGTTVELSMPKFKLMEHTDLKEILEELGIKEVFVSGALNNIADGVFVNQVKQDMFIEITETGTEASAVTIIGVVTGIGPGVEPITPIMTVDRPFLFAIKENSTGVILFTGKVGSINE